MEKKPKRTNSDKNLLKVIYKDGEKKETKDEVNVTRKKIKSKTIIDKNISFSTNYRHCEHLEQNPEFCDYMEDCILSLNNFNKESYRHLFCVFDGHGGDLTAKLCVKKYPEIFKKCLLENPLDYEQALKNSFTLMDKEIEKINILNASLKAMNLACSEVNRLINNTSLTLVDGNKLIKNYNYPQQFIIKGDSKSASIAGASILAKVTRDRYMEKLDEEFPIYNWRKNAGYLTAEHLAAIDKFGLSPYHRVSFLKKHFEKNNSALI